MSAIAQATERITVGRLRVELERVVDRVPEATFPKPAVYMDTANDGSDRLFLPALGGLIRTFDNGTWSNFLDLRSETLTNGPRGLLGLTFHPGYADPLSPGFRKLYTFHSVDPLVTPGTVTFSSGGVLGTGHHNLVTEWQVDASNPNQVDISTRREVFRQAHEDDEHSGGMLEFGPDGYLYTVIGTPRLGNSIRLRAQNLSFIDGKFLRIDPVDPALTPTSTDLVSANGEYRIPADNPFVNTVGAIDEIYAIGARNPFRFSIDPVSNILFAGDVGDGSREEVSAVPAGGNLGYPYREGTIQGPVAGGTGPFVEPLSDYTHQDGRSVTGGYIYRGSIEALQGKYIFGELSWGSGFYDSSTGRLLFMDPFDEIGNLKSPSELNIQEIARGDCGESYFSGFCMLDMALYSFGVDNEGELYAIGVEGINPAPNGVVVYKFEDAYFLPEGDYSENGIVGNEDYALWQKGFGKPVTFGSSIQIGYGADGNRNALVDTADYVLWRKMLGQPGSGGNSNVPEPSLLAAISAFAAAGITARRKRPSVVC